MVPWHSALGMVCMTPDSETATYRGRTPHRRRDGLSRQRMSGVVRAGVARPRIHACKRPVCKVMRALASALLAARTSVPGHDMVCADISLSSFCAIQHLGESEIEHTNSGLSPPCIGDTATPPSDFQFPRLTLDQESRFLSMHAAHSVSDVCPGPFFRLFCGGSCV